LQGQPLDVVLFYADDWRHDTLGVAVNPLMQTPVLDALGREGVRFTKNCVTTSICWVSRATLLSGQYLARYRFKMLGRGRTVVADGQEKEMGFEVPQNETLYACAVGYAGNLGLWVRLDRWWNYDFLED
jgi:arylsulfatase A-like enzyme